MGDRIDKPNGEDYYTYMAGDMTKIEAPAAIADGRGLQAGVEASELGTSTEAVDPECPLGSVVKPKGPAGPS